MGGHFAPSLEQRVLGDASHIETRGALLRHFCNQRFKFQDKTFWLVLQNVRLGTQSRPSIRVRAEPGPHQQVAPKPGP